MRLLGVNIPDNKKVEYALPYFYGIGLTSSRKILQQTKINPDKRTKNLTPDELSKIKEYI